MSRVNIYLPDELAESARAAGLNVSALARSAVEDELAARTGAAWLAQVSVLRRTAVTHDGVLAAVDAAREELGA